MIMISWSMDYMSDTSWFDLQLRHEEIDQFKEVGHNFNHRPLPQQSIYTRSLLGIFYDLLLLRTILLLILLLISRLLLLNGLLLIILSCIVLGPDSTVFVIIIVIVVFTATVKLVPSISGVTPTNKSGITSLRRKQAWALNTPSHTHLLGYQGWTQFWRFFLSMDCNSHLTIRLL